MKPTFKTVLRGVLALGLLAGLTGCIVVKVTINHPHKAKGQSGCCAGTSLVPPKPIEEPTVVSGTLNVPLNWFSTGNGGYNCFPTAQGWDRYYLVVTNFIGTNVTPDQYSFTNIAPKQTNFTVWTCNPHNGASLVTGILTFELLNPSTTRICTTNAGAACPSNGNLSIQTRTMAATKKYRSIVFYKSSTLGTNQTIRVDFSYP